jgi:hypothetical protein
MTLRGLMDAVERGDEAAMNDACREIWRADIDVGKMPWIEPNDIRKAFSGSLDAAKRLHDALLPGWWWSIGTCKVSDDARVSPDDDRRAPDGGEWADYTDVDQRPPGNPARAWLLAILRALDERGEGE